jgi:branched-chain amino acid transport system ATP-binding protein
MSRDAASAERLQEEVPPALVIQDITKAFGGVVAVDRVSLQVRRGETIALIGSNGAGKTSLMKIVTGELRPDAGRIWIDGTDVTRWSAWKRARAGLGRSFQVCRLFDEMTVVENLELAAVLGLRRAALSMLRSIGPDERLRIDDALVKTELGSLGSVRAGDLSQGDRKKLEIAMTAAAGFKVLCLDEPMSGVARGETARLKEVIETGAAIDGLAILLVEHDLEVVFSVANSILVMHGGRVIAAGSAEEIRSDAVVRRVYLGGGPGKSRQSFDKD